MRDDDLLGRFGRGLLFASLGGILAFVLTVVPQVIGLGTGGMMWAALLLILASLVYWKIDADRKSARRETPERNAAWPDRSDEPR